jgi:hypothetical protein
MVSKDFKSLERILLDRAILASETAAETLVTETEKYVPVDTGALRNTPKDKVKAISKTQVQIQYTANYAAAQYYGNLKHVVKGGTPSKIIDNAPPSKRKGLSRTRKNRYARAYRKLRKDRKLEVLPNKGKWLERGLSEQDIRSKIDETYKRIMNNG